MAIAAVHIRNTRQKKTNLRKRKVICPKGVAKCRTVTHRPPGKTKLVDQQLRNPKTPN